MIVKPETLIGWHRKGFKVFWKSKSRVGRPRLPENTRKLIVRMALENPTWGQARVAAELSVKLGIYVSPRTVRAYWPPKSGPREPHRTFSQYWKTFVRNHAQSIVACDFFVVVTSRFRILYVFLLMELGTRRILHCNLTAHPTAEWTLQQFRDAIPTDHAYRFLVRDRDSIFSVEVDDQLNQGRPHSSLGPGIPESVQMAFLDNLTADTSQPGIARSRLGRYSAAYITNTAEKGARHGTGKRICARTPLFQPQNLA